MNKTDCYKDPDWLRNKYHNEKLSTLDMSKICEVDKKTIIRHMKKHGIKRRTRLEGVLLSHEQGKIKYGVSSGFRGHFVSKENKEKMIKAIKEKWKGHKTNHGGGYVVVNVDGKQMLEHRVIMGEYIKRKLKATEDVHHINENKKDNRVENLHLFKDRSSHSYYHKMKNLGKGVELKYEYK